jgi:phosphoserine aminotransferase
MTTATATKRIFNFSAGPAVLPEEVLQQAQQDLWDLNNSGVGVCEHSHRGKVFDAVAKEAEANCRKLGNISDDYHVLFLQGGATLQFAMVPMTFLGDGKTVDIIHTGAWTKKAIGEAKHFGNVHLAYDGTDDHFDHIPSPDEIKYSGKATYVHYCSNNTIAGTEWNDIPNTNLPLVVDSSSNMYSKPIDVSKHAIIFAGAQKNLGPSGCTLVIIRKDFLATGNQNLPLMLNYGKIAEKDSMLNTPPCFAIYMMGLVFKWILNKGGLEAMAQHNQAKAKIVYDAIDSMDFYQAVTRPDSRSLMNITFRTPSEELDAKFIAEALDNDMSGLKGHRSVGGLRASIYNAFPVEGCTALAEFMKDFAQKNG